MIEHDGDAFDESTGKVLSGVNYLVRLATIRMAGFW
jgi:hypothetical protein